MRAAISLFLGVVGFIVGVCCQLQLNANLTGSYQKNFLGDSMPTFSIGFVGLALAGLPWLPLMFGRRK